MGEKKTRGDEEGASKLPAYEKYTIAFLVQDACKISKFGSKAKFRDLSRAIGAFYTSPQYHLSEMNEKLCKLSCCSTPFSPLCANLTVLYYYNKRLIIIILIKYFVPMLKIYELAYEYEVFFR